MAGQAPVSWQDRRAALDADPVVLGVRPDGVLFSQSAPISGRWAHPATGSRGDAAILFFHGGGYSLCSALTHQNMVGFIALGTGVPALLPDYRLAPEHPFPAAVDDAVAAYEWLLSEGIESGRIIIGGDSAGGGLALSMLLAVGAQPDLPRPAGAFVMSPWTDLTLSGRSMDTCAAVDQIAGRSHLEMVAATYLSGADPKTPTASPLWGELTLLPPLLVQVGDNEVLLDDSVRLVEKACSVGVNARLHVYPGMPHVFQRRVPLNPTAETAIAEVCEFVDDLLS